MNRRLLPILACPSCGRAYEIAEVLNRDRDPGRSADAVHTGLLECGCGLWPVCEGVTLLEPGDRRDCLVRLLRSFFSPRVPAVTGFERWQMRRLLLGGRKAWKLALWEKAVAAGAGDSFQRLTRLWPAGYYNLYLRHRLWLPSFTAAIPVIAGVVADRSKPGRPVLDIGCGFGPVSFLLSFSTAAHQRIGMDSNLPMLWAAARYWIPGQTLIGRDLGRPWPFRSRRLGAAIGLDILHYLQNKRRIFREAGRCLAAGAPVAFCHVHGPDCAEPSPGEPLPPEQAERLGSSLNLKTVSESRLLRDFVEEGILNPPAAAAALRKVAGGRSFTLLGAETAIRDRLASAIHPRPPALFGNPLYRWRIKRPIPREGSEAEEKPEETSAQDGEIQWFGRRGKPDPRLLSEFPEMTSYLPERVRLQAAPGFLEESPAESWEEPWRRRWLVENPAGPHLKPWPTRPGSPCSRAKPPLS